MRYTSLGVILLCAACQARTSRGTVESATAAATNQGCEAVEGEVVSDSPKWKRADRDLNGDGTAEQIAADANKCRRGNCFWNVRMPGKCGAYLGTVAGAMLAAEDSDGVYARIQTFWLFPGQERALSHTYEFDDGKYALRRVLSCKRSAGGKFLCYESR